MEDKYQEALQLLSTTDDEAKLKKYFWENRLIINNPVKDDKRTILHHAVQNGKKTAVEVLLLLGANHTLQDKDGKKPAELTADPSIKTLFTQHAATKLGQTIEERARLSEQYSKELAGLGNKKGEVVRGTSTLRLKRISSRMLDPEAPTPVGTPSQQRKHPASAPTSPIKSSPSFLNPNSRTPSFAISRASSSSDLSQSEFAPFITGHAEVDDWFGKLGASPISTMKTSDTELDSLSEFAPLLTPDNDINNFYEKLTHIDALSETIEQLVAANTPFPVPLNADIAIAKQLALEVFLEKRSNAAYVIPPDKATFYESIYSRILHKDKAPIKPTLAGQVDALTKLIEQNNERTEPKGEVTAIGIDPTYFEGIGYRVDNILPGSKADTDTYRNKLLHNYVVGFKTQKDDSITYIHNDPKGAQHIRNAAKKSPQLFLVVQSGPNAEKEVLGPIATGVFHDKYKCALDYVQLFEMKQEALKLTSASAVLLPDNSPAKEAAAAYRDLYRLEEHGALTGKQCKTGELNAENAAKVRTARKAAKQEVLPHVLHSTAPAAKPESYVERLKKETSAKEKNTENTAELLPAPI